MNNNETTGRPLTLGEMLDESAATLQGVIVNELMESIFDMPSYTDFISTGEYTEAVQAQLSKLGNTEITPEQRNIINAIDDTLLIMQVELINRAVVFGMNLNKAFQALGKS